MSPKLGILKAHLVILVMLAGATGSAAPTQARDYVLALSWTSAFCETGAGRKKPECTGQAADGFDATHFVLHGLWPQPRRQAYCNVPGELRQLDDDGEWRRLPLLPLSEETRTALATYMPGAKSDLDRHEWFKHGTCSNLDPDSYFKTGIALVKAMSGTQTSRLIGGHLGQAIPANALCEALTQDFGDRIRQSAEIRTQTLRSQDGQTRTYLVELWLHLSDDSDGRLALDRQHLTGRGGRLRCTNTLYIDAPGH